MWGLILNLLHMVNIQVRALHRLFYKGFCNIGKHSDANELFSFKLGIILDRTKSYKTFTRDHRL